MTVIKMSLSSFLVIAMLIAFTSTGRTVMAQGLGSLTAPGAALKNVQSGFTFTEGPAADAEGNVYFTDIPAERIFKWSWKDGKISLYREKTGQANGLMFDGEGRLVICEMGNNRVTLDDMKGNITVLADSYNRRKLNSPNDLWIDPDGGVYFSDFLMERGVKGTQDGGLQIYYISTDHKVVTRVTDDLVAPNGLIGAPDGKSIYITDPGDNKTWLYTVQPDGSLTDKRLFCERAADGMAMDEENNVYLTGNASISIYSPKGDKIGDIVVPQRPANLTFGGKERKTLFITAGTTVYTLEMAIRGAPTTLDMAVGN